MSDVTETTTINSGTTFDEADPTMPYRLVGSYEYANAVKNLQRLVDRSTPEQLDAYDKVLSSHPELAIYSGMKVDGVPAGWKAQSPGEISTFEDKYQKRGLGWMLALAKVELGATLAAYTKSDQPFSAFPPTAFDGDEYLQILLDDCAAHVNALENETIFQDVIKTRGTADNETMAYLRRLKMIRNMVEMLKNSGVAGLAERLQPVEKKLVMAETKLNAHVQGLNGFGGVSTTTKTRTKLLTDPSKLLDNR